MPPLNYTIVQPYLLEQYIKDDTLYCTFKIEGENLESTAPIVEVDEKVEISKLVSNPSNVRSLLGRVDRRAVGKSKVLETQKAAPTSYSVLALEKATVHAFEGILDQIVYIETTDKWHLVSQFSNFEVFLRQHPLQDAYDKNIMARMLVEMARADGRITEQERLFFGHFLNDDTGRLSVLMQAPALVEQDCVRVSASGRETVFLVVAAAALADYDIQAEEQEKLVYYANLFALDANRRKELMAIAQEYTLEMALKTAPHLWSEVELVDLAQKINCSTEIAIKVYQKYKEKHG